jgi:hypothetical protein
MDPLFKNFKKARILALFLCLLVLMLWIFFDQSKHNPLFSGINVFGEDPYDAVSSFGLLLAVPAALLAVLGSLRPHPGKLKQIDIQLAINRAGIAIIAVLVSLFSDGIALLCHLSTWSNIPAGRLLAGVTFSLLMITLVTGWKLYTFKLSAGMAGLSTVLRKNILIL